MKYKIFLGIGIFFGLVTLFFAGLSCYFVHLAVWLSGIAFIFVFVSLLAAIFFMVPALIFFNESKPVSAARIAVNIALPALVIGGLLIDIGVENLVSSIYVTYSPSKWQTVGSYYKTEMARDFLSKYEVKGMSINDITELLGEPDSEGETEDTEEYPYRFRYDCGKPVRIHCHYNYYLDFFTAGSDRNLVIHDYSLEEGNPMEDANN